LAVSADGSHWVLLNASPDLPQQIASAAVLQPGDNPSKRQSPIVGAVLTNGDVDHIAGLLSLRESQPLAIYASADIGAILAENRIFSVLNPEFVKRRALPLGTRTPISTAAGAPTGLEIEAYPVPGKPALYMEGQGLEIGKETGDTIGLHVTEPKTGASFHYVPGCARLSPALADRLRDAPLVLFDGTLWRDDEMITAGLGVKTGQRMGHMPISGPTGSMAQLEPLGIQRKVFIHINNTNPVLAEDSPERRAAENAGWEVGQDGMDITL
jgi:pyrroloquinoline quinone biosynthesis protein B